MLKGGQHEITYQTLSDGVAHLLGNLDGFDPRQIKEVVVQPRLIKVEEYVVGEDGNKVVDYSRNEAVTRTVYVHVHTDPKNKFEARVPGTKPPMGPTQSSGKDWPITRSPYTP